MDIRLVLHCQKQPNKPNRSNESIDHMNKNKKVWNINPVCELNVAGTEFQKHKQV